MEIRRGLSKTANEINSFTHARLWERYRTRRPHFVDSDCFGYSGSERYAKELDLWAECDGDFDLFENLSWQGFQAKWDAVTETTKQEIAQTIADRLLRFVSGPVTDPKSWKEIAKENDVEVYEYCSYEACPGECAPVFEGDTGIVAGVIAINTAYSDLQQCRIWIHELAHLILFAWLPPLLANFADLCRYNEDRNDVSHQIASMVEILILKDVPMSQEEAP